MNFDFDDEELKKCQEAFNSLDEEDRLYMNQYQLAEQTGIPGAQWKRFLLDTRVSEWLNQEIQIIKRTRYHKMIGSANSSSYGAAQMINALGKSFDNDDSKEGNIFIYSMVPLNTREQGAPNTQMLPYDIFDKEE
jgi:hypothetical protein